MALSQLVAPRRVSLDGCADFRDVGGHRVPDGRVRLRRLYRSDGLHRLRRAGQAQLERLGLRTVVDLRSPAEVARQGTNQSGTVRFFLPMDDRVTLWPGVVDTSADPATAGERYLAMLHEHSAVVQEVLAVLTDPSAYPAVVSCSSGVERTGLIVAVVLGIVGVSDTAIVRNHAASRQAVLRRAGRLRFEHPSALALDVDRGGPLSGGVIPASMARFCSLVRQEYGSFAGYAAAIYMAPAVPYLRAALVDSCP